MPERIDKDKMPHVDFGRDQALECQAVTPANINCLNASVDFRRRGVYTSVPSLKHADESNVRSAIWAAVNTELKARILDDWRESHDVLIERYPTAKSMAVHGSVDQLNHTARYLRERNIHFVVATSHDSPEATRSINAFRESAEVNMILTVQMASEGLNCPSLKNLAILSHIRSPNYIEQIIGRATRYDPNGPPYEEQRAQIFCPEDPLMMEVVEKFGQERPIEIRDQDSDERPGRASVERNSVVPLASHPLHTQVLDLDSRRLVQHVQIEEALSSAGVEIEPDQLDRVADFLLGKPASPIAHLPVTPAQAIKATRRRIDQIVKEAAPLAGMHPKELNSQIKGVFQKPRADMTLEELDRVILWLGHFIEFHTGRA
jgi:hypothetical protein